MNLGKYHEMRKLVIFAFREYLRHGGMDQTNEPVQGLSRSTRGNKNRIGQFYTVNQVQSTKMTLPQKILQI